MLLCTVSTAIHQHKCIIRIRTPYSLHRSRRQKLKMLKSLRWPLDIVTLLKRDLLQNKYASKIFIWVPARNSCQHRWCKCGCRTKLAQGLDCQYKANVMENNWDSPNAVYFRRVYDVWLTFIVFVYSMRFNAFKASLSLTFPQQKGSYVIQGIYKNLVYSQLPIWKKMI